MLAILLSAPARADEGGIGPDATGWWQVGAIAAVTSTGIGEGDLLVEGFGPERSSWQAVAALSFASSGGALAIPLRSSTPVVDTVTACRVTVAFEPASGGSAEEVPAHDCEQPMTAAVEDGTLVLDTSTLAVGDHVRVLLVPARAGRIVLDGANAVLRPTPAEESPPATAVAVDEQPAVAVSRSPVPETSAPPIPVDASATPREDRRPDPHTVTEPVQASVRPRFVPPAGDSAAKLITALVIGAALAAFTALNRGGAARLRPSVVAWQRKDRRS
jgi:hypothetical protein